MNAVITITATASEKIKEVMTQKNLEDGYLRVYVAPGGCSGFSYGMGIEQAPGEEDLVTEENGVRLLVDPMSAVHLEGATVDYVDGLMGAGFTVQNPNAVSTCGCGSSFKTAKDQGQAKPCC